MPAPPVLYPIWMFPPTSMADCLQRIAAAGFDGVSFAGAPLDDPRRLDALSETQGRDLRAQLADLGLVPSLHVFSDPYFQGQRTREEASVRRAQASIEASARALVSPDAPPLVVTLDPICLPPGPEGVVNRELIVEMATFLGELGERFPVRGGLENWPKPQIGTPEALRDVLEAAGGGIGVLLDTGHLNMAIHAEWCAHDSPATFVEALPEPVIEVHLHDNHGESDEHLPPGDGTAPLVETLADLFARGFDGLITLESDLEAEGRPGMERGLEQAREICAEARRLAGSRRSP